MEFFKQASAYEVFLPGGDSSQLLRVEIFKSITDANIFRARIWVQSTYNLYPTFMNIADDGSDLHRVHSSDQVNSEITSVVADDPSLITGKRYDNEDQFLAYLTTLLTNYQTRKAQW